MSAKEIQFSGDSSTNNNLHLSDRENADKITEHRVTNNPANAKAKSPTKKPATAAGAVTGQLVFIKREGDKNSRRDIYLVIKIIPEEDTAIICKVRNALPNTLVSIVPQHPDLRYKVCQTDIILAPNQPPPIQEHQVIDIHPRDLDDQLQDDLYVPDNKVEKQLLPQDNDSEFDEEEDEEYEIWFPQPATPAEEITQNNEENVNLEAEEESFRNRK